MGTTMKGRFRSREDAESVVERLVQEHGIERTDIFVSAAGSENTVGDELSGADTRAAAPSPQERDDAPLKGAVEVSVDINDAANVERVRTTFAEFGGT